MAEYSAFFEGRIFGFGRIVNFRFWSDTNSLHDVCPQDMLFNSEINESVLSFMMLIYANAYSMDIDFSSIN